MGISTIRMRRILGSIMAKQYSKDKYTRSRHDVDDDCVDARGLRSHTLVLTIWREVVWRNPALTVWGTSTSASSTTSLFLQYTPPCPKLDFFLINHRPARNRQTGIFWSRSKCLFDEFNHRLDRTHWLSLGLMIFRKNYRINWNISPPFCISPP
jgi:hypothetical protein